MQAGTFGHGTQQPATRARFIAWGAVGGRPASLVSSPASPPLAHIPTLTHTRTPAHTHTRNTRDTRPPNINGSQDPHDASYAVTFGRTDESDLVCGGEAIATCQQGLYGCTKAAIYSAFALTFGTLATIWFGVWMGATRFYVVYLMSPVVRILTIAVEP